MPRWIENCTSQQSALLYHKFDNARGSDFARVVVVELDAVETMEEELVNGKVLAFHKVDCFKNFSCPPL